MVLANSDAMPIRKILARGGDFFVKASAGWPPQRVRRRLLKQLAVGPREPTEFPKTVTCRDLGNRGVRWIGPSQCPTRLVQPSKREIANRAHTQIPLAAVAERTLRHANSFAHLRQ